MFLQCSVNNLQNTDISTAENFVAMFKFMICKLVSEFEKYMRRCRRSS